MRAFGSSAINSRTGERLIGLTGTLFEAWTYDKTGTLRGIVPVLSASATLRRNAVSSLVLDVDTTSPEFIGDMRGWLIRFRDGFGVEFGGIVTSVTESSEQGVRSTSLNCESFETFLDRMITFPSPDRTPTDQNQASYYRDTGPTEDVVRNLIYRHIGNGAIGGNQAGVLVAVSQGRGTRRVSNNRFKSLLEMCQSACDLDGNFMFESHLTDAGQPRFRFRVGDDLTREIRLSETNGALASWTLERAAPETTRVLVAGQGEGSSRTLVLRTGNANDWGAGNSVRGGLQTTVFQDRRDTDERDDLAQAGDDTLADGAETSKITLELNDIPECRLGTDFLIGDKVTVQLADGAVIQDVVQSATIDWGADGRSLSIHVGATLEDPDDNDPQMLKTVKKLLSRISSLEAR